MSDLKSKEFKTSIDYTHHDSTTRKNCTLVLFDDDGNVIPNNITEATNDVIDSKNDVIETAEPSKVDFRTDESANIGTEVNDLISRADAVRILACEMYAEAQSEGYEVNSIEDYIPEARAWMNDAPSALPSADRPQGEWICKDRLPIDDTVYIECECSVCGEKFVFRTTSGVDNYCGNCGAEMYVPVQEVELTEEALEKMRGAE